MTRLRQYAAVALAVLLLFCLLPALLVGVLIATPFIGASVFREEFMKGYRKRSAEIQHRARRLAEVDDLLADIKRSLAEVQAEQRRLEQQQKKAGAVTPARNSIH